MNCPLLFYLIFLLLSLRSCGESTLAPDDNTKNYHQITQEVETAVWAFHAADTARDAEAIIQLLWPEYTMLVDGKRSNYQDIVEGSRQFMKDLVLFHTEWEDLQIVPVAENAAIASFIFRDSIIDQSGKLIRAQGPNSFLWQKRNGEWRLLYGDADHYSVDEAK